MSQMPDIHRELITKGLDVSYPSVCKYIHKKSKKSPKPKDVYLRIHREPGEECKFDWGEIKLFIGKQKATRKHSRKRSNIFLHCHIFSVIGRIYAQRNNKDDAIMAKNMVGAHESGCCIRFGLTVSCRRMLK